MRKKFLPAVLALCFVLSVPFQASAQEVATTSVQKVQLKLTYVDVPVSEKVNLVRSETADSVKIDVVDKETGKVLNTYGEILEKKQRLASTNLLPFAAAAGDNYIVTTYQERKDGPNGAEAVTRLTVKMDVYSSGSFRQINSILSKTMAVVSSGDFTLESVDTVAISSTGSFPTTKIGANGTGVVTIKKTFTSSTAMQAGIQAWEIANFSVTYTGANAKEFYARKPVSLSLTYDLYKTQ